MAPGPCVVFCSLSLSVSLFLLPSFILPSSFFASFFLSFFSFLPSFPSFFFKNFFYFIYIYISIYIYIYIYFFFWEVPGKGKEWGGRPKGSYEVWGQMLWGVGETLRTRKGQNRSQPPTGSVNLSRWALQLGCRGGESGWSRDQGGVSMGQGQGNQRTENEEERI